jgi:hypothetical protein
MTAEFPKTELTEVQLFAFLRKKKVHPDLDRILFPSGAKPAAGLPSCQFLRDQVYDTYWSIIAGIRSKIASLHNTIMSNYVPSACWVESGGNGQSLPGDRYHHSWP